MRRLEGLQEFRQDLLFRLLSSLHIWMLVSTVDTADVIDIDHAGAIRVHLVEGAKGDGLSASGHWTADGAQEFVILDETATIEVEMSEKDLDLTLGEAEHVVLHRLAEFKLVK